jgi:hypothetical protein
MQARGQKQTDEKNGWHTIQKAAMVFFKKKKIYYGV